MKQTSLPETAYAILTKATDAMDFASLYAEVCKEAELNEDERVHYIGEFYTDLSLDGRFVGLGNNVWDLRSRHKYEEVHMDMSAVYSEVESADQTEEDKQEEKEYDAAVEGKSVADLASDTPEEGEEGEEKPEGNSEF